ncbi:MAG: hypothetical protein M3O46_21325 [Myxococcota bacterium]|nr:hypothetical protein [Myxococcota bacterium]
MARRTHFWLRLFGLAIIVALEFGPKIWAAAATPSPAPMAAAAINAR